MIDFCGEIRVAHGMERQEALKRSLGSGLAPRIFPDDCIVVLKGLGVLSRFSEGIRLEEQDFRFVFRINGQGALRGPQDRTVVTGLGGQTH